LDLLKASDRATIANGNEPASKLLPESDIADMEYFLDQLQTALPVVGHDFLRPKLNKSPDQLHPSGSTSSTLTLILESKKHGVEAKALESDGEILVLAGSKATKKAFYSPLQTKSYTLLLKTPRSVAQVKRQPYFSIGIVTAALNGEWRQRAKH
jgi:hypothetical protein